MFKISLNKNGNKNKKTLSPFDVFKLNRVKLLFEIQHNFPDHKAAGTTISSPSFWQRQRYTKIKEPLKVVFHKCLEPQANPTCLGSNFHAAAIKLLPTLEERNSMQIHYAKVLAQSKLVFPEGRKFFSSARNEEMSIVKCTLSTFGSAAVMPAMMMMLQQKQLDAKEKQSFRR